MCAEILTSMVKGSPRKAGVYSISCDGTNEVYIGLSGYLASRYRKHCSDLRRGKHHNERLSTLYAEGRTLRFEPLEIIEDPAALAGAEARWVERVEESGGVVLNARDTIATEWYRVSRKSEREARDQDWKAGRITLTEEQSSRFSASYEETSSGCWVWRYTLSHGYGVFGVDGYTQRPAHRIAYILANGSIPSGLVVHHTCKNRACVNPAHLRAVTIAENVTVESDSPPARHLLKDHCPRGHVYDTIRKGANGRVHRGCSICRKAEKARSQKRCKQRYWETRQRMNNGNKPTCKRGHVFDLIRTNTKTGKPWRDCSICRAIREARRPKRRPKARGSTSLSRSS